MKNITMRQKQKWLKNKVFIVLSIGFVLLFAAGTTRIPEISKPSVTKIPVNIAQAPDESEAAVPVKSLSWLGWFSAYAYCPCARCCGKSAGGVTAIGINTEEGRTIAVDPAVIPLTSTVYIDGQAYQAEDTGRGIKGKKLDIFFERHKDAKNYGVREVRVWIELPKH